MPRRAVVPIIRAMGAERAIWRSDGQRQVEQRHEALANEKPVLLPNLP
jgi:hypothetical protein